MTVSPHNSALTAGRALMDKALAAPTGLRIHFLVGSGPKEYPSPEVAQAAALRTQQSCLAARSAQRRLNKRVFAGDKGQLSATALDLSDLAITSDARTGSDPDVIRTDYDQLQTYIEPVLPSPVGEVPMTSHGFVLVIRKPDLSSLDIAEF